MAGVSTGPRAPRALRTYPSLGGSRQPPLVILKHPTHERWFSEPGGGHWMGPPQLE